MVPPSTPMVSKENWEEPGRSGISGKAGYQIPGQTPQAVPEIECGWPGTGGEVALARSKNPARPQF